MLKAMANSRLGWFRRALLGVMLVLLQFYSFGSDFFPESMGAPRMELVDAEVPEVGLDFDDNASLRTVRQEQVKLCAWASDLIADLLNVIDLHERIHTLEWRQCASLPLYYNLHKAETFIWFCVFRI